MGGGGGFLRGGGGDRTRGGECDGFAAEMVGI